MSTIHHLMPPIPLQADTGVTAEQQTNAPGQPITPQVPFGPLTALQDAQNRIQGLLSKGVRPEGLTCLDGKTLDMVRGSLSDIGKSIENAQALCNAAAKCDEAAAKLNLLPMADLCSPDAATRFEAETIITEYINAQHVLYKEIRPYTDGQSSPSTKLLLLMKASQSRASEALNLFASAPRFVAEMPDTNINVSQAMAETGSHMHGTHSVVTNLAKKMQSLCTRMSKLEMGTVAMSEADFNRERQALEKELRALGAQVQDVREKGLRSGGKKDPVLMADRDILGALDPTLALAHTNLEHLQHANAVKAFDNALSAAILPIRTTDVQEIHNLLTIMQPANLDVVNLDKAIAKYHADATALKNLPNRTQVATAKLDDLNKNLLSHFSQDAIKTLELIILIRTDPASDNEKLQYLQTNRGFTAAKSQEILTAILGMPAETFTAIASLMQLFSTNRDVLHAEAVEVGRMGGNSGNSLGRGEFLMAAIAQHVNPATMVEATLRGLPLEQLDLAADDTRRRGEPRKLGQGAANTVYLNEYRGPDGNTMKRVFKAEVQAARGLSHLLAYNYGFASSTRVMQINLATTHVANAIGCGDVVAKAKVGVCEGKVGLMMEQAPGTLPAKVLDRINVIVQDRPDLQPVILTNLMREMCKLEWADALSGQVDRHQENYLVDVDPTTGAVKITGIDNDASFGQNNLGMGRVNVINIDFKKLTQAQVPYSLRRPDVDLLSLDDAPLATLRNVLGFNQLFKPQHIDAATHSKLMELNNPAAKEAYRAGLQGLMSPEMVDAAMTRLDAAISHAQMLESKGRVVTDWSKPYVKYVYDEQLAIKFFDQQPTTVLERARANFIVRDFAALLN